MYTTELNKYCERHGLVVLEQYTTWGDSGTHVRARVNTANGEVHYLYYDRSRKRRSIKQQKRDLAIYQKGGIPPIPSARGWRNVTLDNRKSVLRTNSRTCDKD